MSDPVLIVAAMSQEIDPALRKRKKNVRFLFTGMGPRRAHAAVRRSLSRRRYRMVVSVGFSGATRHGFKTGDLVTASEVIDLSSGRRLEPAVFLSDQRTSMTVGRFVTADRLILDLEAKKKLGMDHDAIAVDMETAAVGSAALEAGIAWTTIRVILDPMEDRLAVTSWRDACRLMMVPSRWKQFRRLMSDLQAARAALARGLDSIAFP